MLVASLLVVLLAWALPAAQHLDGPEIGVPTPRLEHGFYACLVETIIGHPGLIPGSASGFELEYVTLRTYSVTTWLGTRTISPAGGGMFCYRGWMEPVYFSLDCPTAGYR